MKIIQTFLLAFILTAFVQTAFAKNNLKLALDFVRHGDRAPTTYLPELSSAWTQEELGQLTPLGAKDAEALGKKFREYYINKTHLLPEKFDAESVSIKSTDYQRTINTASNIMKGFYPANANEIKVEVKPLEEDVVMRNRAKFRKEEFRKLRKENDERAANSQSEPYVSAKRALADLNKIFGTNYSSIGEFVKIGDLIKASKIHNRPLLKKIDADLEEKFVKLPSETRLLWFSTDPKIPCIYSQDLVSYVADVVENRASQPKYILYAAHDTSILGATFLLNTPATYNPPFLSNLRFEIFQDTKTNETFVKTSLDGKTFKVCSTELCPADDFVKTLRANVESKCKQSMG